MGVANHLRGRGGGRPARRRKIAGKRGRIVTLTTDFGLADPFVGVMRGVMLGINPALQCVDLTHGIEPHQLRQAAYILEAACPYFPPQTIHLVVVDPGVGGERRPILVEAGAHYFVAPDNGVLSLILQRPGRKRIIELTNRAYFLSHLSATFHGRDLFAPVAAWLSRGVDPARMGRGVEEACQLSMAKPQVQEGEIIVGEIIHVDRFGNLISNISEPLVCQTAMACAKNGLTIQLGSGVIERLTRFYQEGERQPLAALFNSWGLLEVYSFCQRADDMLKVGVGEPLWVRFGP